jgi:type IV secretion system protein VirB10
MSEAAAYEAGDPQDVRPIVRTASPGRLGAWIFGALLLAGGLALFLTLNARRQELAAPATTATSPGSSGGMIAAPPPLSLQQAYPEPYLLEPAARTRAVFPQAGPVAQPPVVTRYIERPSPVTGSNNLVLASPPTAAVPVTLPAIPPPVAAPTFDPDERVSASRLINPSMTIPKGTIVAAVLETALDSSRAGGVRAIVSRDVRSFDGSRVLIPRGSRLYGEYAADVSAGQRRAMIEWQRLLRPDGVTIELASPSADPLGRAGVGGKVHSNFIARFGGAILQSVLDVGVALATGAVLDDAVIVNLPASAQQATGDAVPPPPQPRLSVRQGTSVSVFVARDLDFSSVGG